MSDLVPVREDTFGVPGMEDVGVEDLVMPRIKIDGPECVFVDSLSGQEYDDLDVVLLGVVKQRTLWPPEMEGGDPKPPICRANNGMVGTPSSRFFEKFNGKTPLEVSGFSRTEVEEDTPCLSCTSCNLKEWDSHPTRDNPWCGEMHSYAVLLEENDEGPGYPAILTLQRSGLKPSRAYLSSFVRAKKPLFVNRTKLTLKGNVRGSVNYAVPLFKVGDPTDSVDHERYAETYRMVREFLHQSAPTADEATITVETVPPKGAKRPPAEPIEVPTEDDADLPF